MMKKKWSNYLFYLSFFVILITLFWPTLAFGEIASKNVNGFTLDDFDTSNSSSSKHVSSFDINSSHSLDAKTLSLKSVSNPYFSWENWQNYKVSTFSDTAGTNYSKRISESPYNWSGVLTLTSSFPSFGDTKPFVVYSSTNLYIQTNPKPTNTGVTDYTLSAGSDKYKYVEIDKDSEKISISNEAVNSSFRRTNYVLSPSIVPLPGYVGADSNMLGSNIHPNYSTFSDDMISGIAYFPDNPGTMQIISTFKYTSNASNGGQVFPYGYGQTYSRTISNRKFLEPEVVKVFHKDIDTGANVSPPQVLGKNGSLYDEVEANKLSIPGYTYSNGKFYQLDHMDTNNQSEAVIDSNPYRTKMDLNKKAIVYFYKKGNMNLSIDKSVDKSVATVGETVNYQLKPQNTGSISLTKPIISDVLPTGMEKPSDIRVNNLALAENSENANSYGQYYTWNQNTRTLKIFSQNSPLTKESNTLIDYKSKVLEGINNEEKTNTATLTGENDGGNEPKGRATFRIKTVDDNGKRKIHIKQEVYAPLDGVVVPSIGFLTLLNVDKNNTQSVKETYTITIPSYVADTNASYRSLGLRTEESYRGYVLNIQLPAMYKYVGYQVTTSEGTHLYVNSIKDPLVLLDYESNKELWVTIYIQPSIIKNQQQDNPITDDLGSGSVNIEEGKPYFYSWDYKVNDFNTISLK